VSDKANGAGNRLPSATLTSHGQTMSMYRATDSVWIWQAWRRTLLHCLVHICATLHQHRKNDDDGDNDNTMHS